MQAPDHEFHVVRNEIQIDFRVPLPAEGADDVLIELLSHHAIEIVNDRIRRGQPLDGIPIAQISATRLGEPVNVATLDLGAPGEIEEVVMPSLIRGDSATGYDPLRRFADPDENNVLPLADRGRSDDLAPIGSELRLTAGVAAGLRSMGVDPETMTVTELAKGLLDMAGYALTDRADGTLVASGSGASTLVYFVEHKPGDYPELSPRAVAAFLVAFVKARTERGLLVTDKYGPYSIYKKERANPDCRFATRERLQGLVDLVALG